jgi:hypothetical protein
MLLRAILAMMRSSPAGADCMLLRAIPALKKERAVHEGEGFSGA